MLVLGLMGSPRKKGNTNYLLSLFMEEAGKLGAETVVIDVTRKNIKPCMEYIVCEKKGVCPIEDDMEEEIIPLLRKADVIVPATPIFFYSCTAQLKLLIDRTQSLWARKYMMKLTDPARNYRRGFLLALGATKGKNLFEGMIYTAKYLFDAVGAKYAGELTYRRVEKPGDMEKHATVQSEVKEAVEKLLKPLLSRKKVLFISETDSSLSQVACAYMQLLAGGKIETASCGNRVSDNLDESTVEVMHEKGIDMGYREQNRVDEILENFFPEIVVYLGSKGNLPGKENVVEIEWGIPEKDGISLDEMRELRDDIELRVKDLIVEVSE
jgi:arsenate reductase (thioredoxin)